ncbi:MAG: hypothetical protein HY695_36035 [Deltaproteobacteria bacterium]|nr:hypothetical protein [Deltaproteobacteria bacterium]
MKRKILTLVGLLFALMLLSYPLPVLAEGMEPNPLSWDFGDVEVGSSSTTILTLTSTGMTPVVIDSVVLENNATGSFAVLNDARLVNCDPRLVNSDGEPVFGVPPPSVTLFPLGCSLEFVLEFTPSGLGLHTADLRIRSTAHDPYDYFLVPLQGVGIPEVLDPGELMTNLMRFFNVSVADGALIGHGPGHSADHRLKAFGNMLKASSDLIEAGAYDLACTQLRDALNRTDGAHPPPDLVAGAAGEELADMIVAVMDGLGCP